MISLAGLTKRYRGAAVVEDLSFGVPAGSITAFLGPNGAGKSTTLRMLVGLVRPTSGGATIGGRRYRELDDPARMVGAVVEADTFHRDRTGRQHLRIVAASSRLPDRRVDEVLEQTGLDDAADRRVGGYSLGMRQRLGLAAALLGSPPTLVLDEPANGLDPAGVRWLRSVLADHRAADGAVLFTTHALSEVALLADRVVAIDRGRLVLDAHVDDLAGERTAVVTVGTDDPAGLTEALAAEGAEVARRSVTTLEVRGLDAATVGAVARHAGVTVHELSARTPSVEDRLVGVLENRTPRSGRRRDT